MQNGMNQGNYAIQQGNALSAGLVGASNAYTGYQDRKWQQNMLSSWNNNRIYQNASDTGYSGWSPTQLRAGTDYGWTG